GNLTKQIDMVGADASPSHEAKAASIEKLRAEWETLKRHAKGEGGVRINSTERHKDQRTDKHSRHSTRRQIDRSSGHFYLSLEDPLMRICAGDRVRAIMERLKLPEGEPIEAGMVTRSIETAQRKVEGRNFDIRKQLLEYDDVANDQRKVLYSQRNEVLE